ncbi:hypothetical protein BDF21DRAFT_454937 [Thamnidium elegans]|nr:hypothetical protein BDF21DRAFT_454937 [Thamnidium elegans]
MFDVRLDALPDNVFNLFGTSLKYEGPKVPVMHPIETSSALDVSEQANTEDVEESESSEDEEGGIDLTPTDGNNWRVTEVSTDARLVSGFNYRTNKTRTTMISIEQFYSFDDPVNKELTGSSFRSNIVIQSVMMDQTEDGSQFLRVEIHHSKADRIGYR